MPTKSEMKSIVRAHVPRSLWTIAAIGKNAVLDSVDTVLGRRDPMIPPRRMIYIGSGDFRSRGDEFLGYFRDLCGLGEDESVLDVGCGIGRMAIPLTSYLSPRARYEGFDIVESGIRWCSERITPRYPNFRFQVADIYNKEYRPQGKCRGTEYVFPFADASFEFVFVTSVFTHMLPNEVGNYLREMRRVLKPTGRCLITWFLLNQQSEALIEAGKSSLDLRHQREDTRVTNPQIPEEAIAYPEIHVQHMYRESGFTVDVINYGAWPGREQFVSYQDMVVAH